jgi:type IV pilus assembly protein PilX
MQEHTMKTAYRLRSREQGAILVVSLLLLLIMTVLALTASQTTRLQERMAGNSRDTDLAFQGAEAGLRAAERAVEDQAESAGRAVIPPCANVSTDCTVADRPDVSNDFLHADADWWEENAVTYGDPEVQEFADLADDPLYRTELWAEVPDTLTAGAKPMQQTGTAFYSNTSRSLGGTETAEVVVQSVYATPFVR